MTDFSHQSQWLTKMLVLVTLGLPVGCQETKQHPSATENASAPTSIRFNGSSYELLRYGKPYFIKGGAGVTNFEQLKAVGGNSIRIWNEVDAEQILDEAQRLGLTVMLGVWVERQVEGFDYYDQKAVEQQYNRIRKTILKYRNHPALLLWCLGNEVMYEADNIKAYDEVNRLADLVHELDPNHPVSTAIMSPSERSIRLVRERCPSVDILSINNYMFHDLNQYFSKDAWPKSYIISEYGPQAFWDVPVAPWGAPDEPNSQQKVSHVRQYYTTYIGSRQPNCLGGYLFYWGSKKEESDTWFSIFDRQGRETPLVGLMQELWSGSRPLNQAPTMQALLVDRSAAPHRSFVAAPGLHRADVRVRDPDGDSLTYHWEIKFRANSEAYNPGSTLPDRDIPGLITPTDSATVRFRLPQKPGAYRLFVHVYDPHQHVATANFSFEVRPAKQTD